MKGQGSFDLLPAEVMERVLWTTGGAGMVTCRLVSRGFKAFIDNHPIQHLPKVHYDVFRFLLIEDRIWVEAEKSARFVSKRPDKNPRLKRSLVNNEKVMLWQEEMFNGDRRILVEKLRHLQPQRFEFRDLGNPLLPMLLDATSEACRGVKAVTFQKCSFDKWPDTPEYIEQLAEMGKLEELSILDCRGMARHIFEQPSHFWQQLQDHLPHLDILRLADLGRTRLSSYVADIVEILLEDEYKPLWMLDIRGSMIRESKSLKCCIKNWLGGYYRRDDRWRAPWTQKSFVLKLSHVPVYLDDDDETFFIITSEVLRYPEVAGMVRECVEDMGLRGADKPTYYRADKLEFCPVERKHVVSGSVERLVIRRPDDARFYIHLPLFTPETE